MGMLLDNLKHDVRYSLRGLRRNPAFALAAVCALALGIGAATAVFSVVDRILFRSLPYPDASRLVSLGFAAPIDDQEFMLGADYVEWREAQQPFAAMTTWTPGTECSLTEGNPVRLACIQVESTFLPALGIRPLLGRNFTREEDQPNAPGVALLSYGLWQGRFGGEVQVIGKTISLDGRPVRVIGILPRDFEFPTLAQADLLLPQQLDLAQQQRPRTGQLLRAIARLKPGVTIHQATARMQPLFEQSLHWIPAGFRKEVRLRIRSLRDRQVQDARLASWILLGAVIAVLLIACANVANLLLARAASRQHEVAVRAALGASRGRLVRQGLTESLLLGIVGCAAGCILARLFLRVFVVIAPAGIPHLHEARLDLRVLGFALAASLLSALLFGMAPALQQSSPRSLTGSRTAPAARTVFRQLLVAAQIAISMVLLSSAGLLLRSLWNLVNAPLGMNAESVTTASLMLPRERYPQPAQQEAFFDQLEARLRRSPGVTAVAFSDSLPPGGMMRSMIYSVIDVDGRPRIEEGTRGMVAWRTVTPEYFRALDIAILRGRGFREEDRTSGDNVAILSGTLARRMFPREDPLGRRIRPGRSGPWLTVIGIAANVKNNGPSAAADPEYYVVWKRPLQQPPYPGSNVIVRASMDSRLVARWITDAISTADPTLPVTAESMSSKVSHFVQRPRFNAVLLGLFAAMGVLLAAVGLYGVIAFLVVQRTQEIGIRMALGATPGSVSRLVLAHAMRWTLAGALAGIAGSLFAAASLRALLFEVPPNDPRMFGAALGLLGAVAMAAAWTPARRAARLDPMAALRRD